MVDDEPDTLEVVGAALRHAGAQVTSASSAAEDAALRGVRPDILISDLAMPGENGFDLITRFAPAGERGGNVPAVALSAFTGVEDRRHAMKRGLPALRRKARRAAIGARPARAHSLARSEGEWRLRACACESAASDRLDFFDNAPFRIYALDANGVFPTSTRPRLQLLQRTRTSWSASCVPPIC